MKRFPQGELRLDEKCFKDNLGKDNIIFVGSSTDMFADNVPSQWIRRVMNYCGKYNDNTYLFQTKNPYRFKGFLHYLPKNSILGTTIETTKNMSFGAYSTMPAGRLIFLEKTGHDRKMVSIEPIVQFDKKKFVKWIKEIKPEFVSIGADTKGHNLPEPNWEQVQELIQELKKFTRVIVKPNLERLKC